MDLAEMQRILGAGPVPPARVVMARPPVALGIPVSGPVGGPVTELRIAPVVIPPGQGRGRGRGRGPVPPPNPLREEEERLRR